MPQDSRGGDFASAAMMRLVAAGLARQGITAATPPAPGAHVPHADKRAVLERVLAQRGAKAILEIADALPFMPAEPVLQALTRARDANDLLDRWSRLERFSHARHAVRVERVEDGRLRLTHTARDGGSPPSFAESLLVFGVIAALAEVVGAGPVTLETAEGDRWRNRGCWISPRVTAAAGPVLLSSGRGVPSASTPDRDDPITALRRRLASDPLRRWTVAAVAAEAGTSARSLQRALAREHLSFSRLIAEARLEVAASLLCKAEGPGLAEIGFLAGYSDQAHFARSFRRAVGTTPRAYRADFAR